MTSTSCPTKSEIQQVFKRLRSVQANKVGLLQVAMVVLALATSLLKSVFYSYGKGVQVLLPVLQTRG